MCLLVLMSGSARTARIFWELTHPSQKMNDDEVRNLDMWLIVEELKAHQVMMTWGRVFGVLVPEVGDSRGPVNIELTLTSAIPDPVEVHVNRL